MQIYIKRASKVIHPEDGTYVGAKDWSEGKKISIMDIPSDQRKEELRKRWQAIYQLPPENASQYDDYYGNRLIEYIIVLDGMKPNGKNPPESHNTVSTFFGHGGDMKRIDSNQECISPQEAASFIKRSIRKFYFGDDEGNNTWDTPDPTWDTGLEPETTYNPELVPSIPNMAFHKSWFKKAKQYIAFKELNKEIFKEI